MSEANGNAKRWGRWCSAVFAVAVAVGLLWPVSEPTLPISGDQPGLAKGTDAPVIESEVSAGPRGSMRTAAALPGVHGRLLDHSGEPLPGFEVWLRPIESFAGQRVVAGADGSYAFPVVIGGDYLLSTVPFGEVRKKLTIAVGEHVEWDLQLPPHCVATTGQVLRAGQPQKSLHLWRRVTGQWQGTASTGDGTYRIVLPVGTHSIGVMSPATMLDRDLPSYVHALHVPKGTPRFAWTMPLPCSDLIVDVHDELGRPLPRGNVTIRYLSDGVGMHKLSRPTAAKGTRFAFVPPGTYEVSLQDDSLVEVPTQRVTIAQIDRRERLRFVAEKAAMVVLQVRHRGRAFACRQPESMPVLHAGGAEFAYSRLPGRSRGDHAFGYFRVPLGRVTVVADDRLLDDEWQFLAFDGIGEHVLDALADWDNVLALTVTPRARVDLRACERGGREQLSASIEVFAGERRVRSNQVSGCQRFDSFLPPGDYRIVIDRGGAQREHSLRVGRQDIRLRLRP